MWKAPSYKCTHNAYYDPPCAGEMSTWGAPTASYITTEFRSFGGVSAFSDLLADNSQVAMRWTGEFQASESGPMSFYIHSAMPTNVLFIDGIEVTRGKSTLATAMKSVGTIFVTEKQW